MPLQEISKLIRVFSNDHCMGLGSITRAARLFTSAIDVHHTKLLGLCAASVLEFELLPPFLEDTGAKPRPGAQNRRSSGLSQMNSQRPHFTNNLRQDLIGHPFGVFIVEIEVERNDCMARDSQVECVSMAERHSSA